MESDDPYAIVGQFLDAVAAGSYRALSHATLTAEQAEAFETFQSDEQLAFSTHPVYGLRGFRSRNR
jgi:hypothetical protein